jgi:hypothetical protein
MLKPQHLLILAALSFLASCATTTQTGPTPYLEAFHPQSLPTSDSFVSDNISYWDGTGVPGAPSITISLSEQKAYFYKGGKLVGVSALSTGDVGHRTPTGSFKIIQKNKWHRSNLYGDYVDASGRVVKADIDVNKDPRPPGTTFLGSKMTHFMRFNGGIGMHEGFLPGYPASHGCVRMPAHMAEIFFHNVDIGTPVIVKS